MTQLQAYLPTRSAEDIWAERIPLRLGDRDIALRVLPMGPNAAWKERAEAELRGLFATFEGINDPKDLMAFLSRLETDTVMGLLRGYDRDGVLPDDEWMRENVSEGALLRAFIEVLAAAHPTAAVVVDTLASDPAGMVTFLMTALTKTSTAPMKHSPPATDGPPPGRGRTSPTSSSSRTSTPARRASAVNGASSLTL